MSELIPKSQVDISRVDEVRIVYAPKKNLVLGQVINLVFMLLWIVIFLGIVTGLLSGNVIFILLVINIILGLLKLKIPSNALKEIILTAERFRFNYRQRMNNRERYIRPVFFLDFKVNMLPSQIDIWFLETKITLHSPLELPIFMDNVAELFEMEYYDTCRLSDGKEVLMYKPKNVTKPIYTSLLSIRTTPNTIKIHDINNQINWIEFDTSTRIITYSNLENSGNLKPTASFAGIRSINIGMNAGKYVSNNNNELFITITRNTLEKITVFKTQIRNKRDELTTLRDVDRLVKLIVDMQALRHVEVTKEILY